MCQDNLIEGCISAYISIYNSYILPSLCAGFETELKFELNLNLVKEEEHFHLFERWNGETRISDFYPH